MVVYKLDSWFAASAINAIQSHAIQCWQRTTRVSYAHTRDPVWACDRYLGQGGWRVCLHIVFVVAYRKDTKELSAVVGIWLDSSKEAFSLCHVWYLLKVCGSFVQTTSSIWQPMLRKGRPIYLFYRKDLLGALASDGCLCRVLINSNEFCWITILMLIIW